MKNIFQLALGFFRLENCTNPFSKILEFLSRCIWQQPQTLIGFLGGVATILSGRVKSIHRFYGCTAIEGGAINGRSSSLGIYLALNSIKDKETNVGIGPGSYTTMHEYGHYQQSRWLGPIYLLVIGIPSFFRANFAEHDANRRAARYFQRIENRFTWNENYYEPGSRRHKYSRFKI